MSNRRLIIFDTSNFRDYPIGGQLTSIKNYLKYLSESFPEHTEDVLLVGISLQNREVGLTTRITFDNCTYKFIAVASVSNDLRNVKQSLRFVYAKGLWKYRNAFELRRDDVAYIHTPEAYFIVRMMNIRTPTIVFSHGNFFNMGQGFRFGNQNKLLLAIINSCLKSLIKRATHIFVLDNMTKNAYYQFSNRVSIAKNSVLLPDIQTRTLKTNGPIRLLFVGRLSKIKNVTGIIAGLQNFSTPFVLNIVGDGEEFDEIQKSIVQTSYPENFIMNGAKKIQEIDEFYRSSDILILNSRFEGVPMTLLEAMSWGLPVVTSKVGGIGTVVRNNMNGVFTDGTSKSICSAIQQIIRDYNSYTLQSRITAEEFNYRYVNRDLQAFLNLYLKWD